MTRFCLAVAAVLPTLAVAADLAWTTHGPDGGNVTAIAIDPADPATVYAGTYTAGLFKTTDGGASWAPANAGLPIGTVAEVAVDPAAPATLYLISNGVLYRSTDAAAHWSQLVLPAVEPGRVPPQTLAFDPRDRDTLLIGGCNAFFRSRDRGASWTVTPFATGGGFICPTHLTVDPADPNRLYAGSSEGLLRSADGGATWTLPLRAQLLIASGSLYQTCDTWGYYFGEATGKAAPKPEELNLCAAGRDVPVHLDGYMQEIRIYIGRQPNPAMFGILGGPEAIAVDPRTAGVLYASNVWGAFKSTDYGAVWNPVSGLPKTVMPPTLTIDADATLYVSVASQASRAVYRSVDGGASWAPVADFGPQAPTFLSDDRRRAGVVYGSNLLSLYKTVDRGVTWTPINRGLSTSNISSIAVDPDDPNRVFAVVPSIPFTGGGLFESVDAGVTWRDAAFPANTPSTVVTARGGVVYAAACCGPSLFLRAAPGASWVSSGAPKDPIARLIVDSQDSSTLYAQTRAGIATSTDGGAHWREGQAADLFKNGIAVFVSDPVQRGVLYASRYNSDGKDGGIYRSADAGVTWDAVDTGWPKDLYNVVALVVDPHNPATLYAATQELDCDFLYVCSSDIYERSQAAQAAGVWKTTDAGRTWSKLTFPARVPPFRLIGDPRDSATLYAVADYPNRIFRTTDAGATWTDISPGYLGVILSGLAAGGDLTPLYAATNGAGIFELTAAERVPLSAR